jgi:hypothetical protein
MEVGRHRSMTANEHITVGINCYENVKSFIYISSLLTNQNYIHEEMKCRHKADDSFYYSITFIFFNSLYECQN